MAHPIMVTSGESFTLTMTELSTLTYYIANRILYYLHNGDDEQVASQRAINDAFNRIRKQQENKQ